MQVANTLENLMDVETALVLRDHRTTSMQLHHRSLLAQFQHDVHILTVREEAVELDHVWVVERFVDLDFLRHFVSLVVLHHQLLGHDLAGILAISSCISYLVAFCKTTLSRRRREKRKTKRKTKRMLVD